ncbi:MAG: N-acetyltransferase [Proteobacteria bacterium]|nr:N-acetyltransferase [Pseudomonadota bacterium]
MAAVVQRLSGSARDAYREHLLALPPQDVYLRFGAAMKPEAIAAYVDHIHFDRDVVFAIHDHELRMQGAAHVAFGDDEAELGVSVLPGHRGRGHGSALVARAVEHVRNRFHRRVYMHCLAENASMMRIARRAGMDIVLELGEADAYLALPPANPLSVSREAMHDRLALFDFALKANVATMARVRRALAGDEGGSAA